MIYRDVNAIANRLSAMRNERIDLLKQRDRLQAGYLPLQIVLDVDEELSRLTCDLDDLLAHVDDVKVVRRRGIEFHMRIEKLGAEAAFLVATAPNDPDAHTVLLRSVAVYRRILADVFEITKSPVPKWLISNGAAALMWT